MLATVTLGLRRRRRWGLGYHGVLKTGRLATGTLADRKAAPGKRRAVMDVRPNPRRRRTCP